VAARHAAQAFHGILPLVEKALEGPGVVSFQKIFEKSETN